MTERLTDDQLRDLLLSAPCPTQGRAAIDELLVLRARVATLEGVIQTQNGVVVSGTLKLNEARARVAKLERALNLAVSRGCEHCSESIRQARAALMDPPQ
jgi:hypothetical protein